ncbi:hypothetical protein JZ751_012517 [Albula glossodonta]|uniref:Uncharacterized protein n=1 Tax=Albula glossodonta TaxID=121402 RepID=A0A8T2NY26_9TELE|nr:hypothetical protein JZ751_012517 [Albula glossodonta]
MWTHLRQPVVDMVRGEVSSGGPRTSGSSFFSDRRLPAARAATSFRSAADDVMDASERKVPAGASVVVPDSPLSLTFLDRAANVELADCVLKGGAKASKRPTSSPATEEMEEDEEDEEDEGQDEEEEAIAAALPLSCSTALAAAFSFRMAESGDRLLEAEQPPGGHASEPPAQTRLPPPAPPPFASMAGLKRPPVSCLTDRDVGEGEGVAERASPNSEDTTEDSVSCADPRRTGVGQPAELSPDVSCSSGASSPPYDDSEGESEAFPNQPSSSGAVGPLGLPSSRGTLGSQGTHWVYEPDPDATAPPAR